MSEHITRPIVNTRSGGRCERCGQTGTTIHHRRKRSRAGRWSPDNCVALCGDGARGCHGWTETHPDEAVREGWLIPSWGPSPELVPVVVASLGMQVWLAPDGGYLLDQPEPPESAAQQQKGVRDE
ncbi:HNH endonuclease [Williamsia herbipolensis]|uniref:HNH endonuclease n=1 Tax=Williamsia herbipolensis TaxID=1603258 RepID=A0AAU4JZX4_9NOCA|nr:HNH endonuclease [Williamsia herbipolensis]